MNELQKQDFLEGNLLIKLKGAEDVVKFVEYCVLNNIKYDKNLNNPTKFVKQNTTFLGNMTESQIVKCVNDILKEIQNKEQYYSIMLPENSFLLNLLKEELALENLKASLHTFA